MENKKKVLVVGGGGRCHAIVDALSRSPRVGEIFCAPGNAGIAAQATCVPLKDTDVDGLKRFALENGVDLTVVGPEAALEAGITDAFREAGLPIFGHTKGATAIESSKSFAKELMLKYGVPTAAYRTFTDYSQARDYVAAGTFPAVIKYDGLAAGKGVVVAEDFPKADAALRDMLCDGRYGEGKVVVEEYLSGPEFSFMAFVSGREVAPMICAQDHKRAFDADLGPNTGGMGAYTEPFATGRSGLSFISDEDYDFALREVLQRTADAMVEEGRPLSGVLYAGLMKTPDGIRVIEFNARFGDPETGVVLPRLQGDIYDIFSAVANAEPLPQPLWSDVATLGVVLASKGYPDSYEKGVPLCTDGCSGEGRLLYHMGTVRDASGTLVTSGGRVLMAIGCGATTQEAGSKAYEALSAVKCDNLFWRSDIGKHVLTPVE